MPFLLPEKHLFSHNYCFYLHDLLVRIIIQGEKDSHFDVNIPLRSDDIQQFEKLSGDALYTWMIKNGYEKEANLLTYRQIFVATISDFLQFIFHALRSSEKGHLSVVYSLLRKPLKDNLFILELLLCDPEGFLAKFESDNSYDEIAIEKFKPDYKKKIIKRACSLLSLNVDPLFIYDIRYSKSKDYSFEHLWQKATHIVTSCKHYRTEQGNLNFVFSSNENKVEQWDFLYLILPTILFYAAQICHFIYNGINDDDKDIVGEFIVRMSVGYMISAKLSTGTESLSFDTDLAGINLKCNRCGASVPVEERVSLMILNNGTFYCSKKHKSDFFALNYRWSKKC